MRGLRWYNNLNIYKPNRPRSPGSGVASFLPEGIPMIVFEANYSKKLGLPGYSSHQYSVTIRTELADISQVTVESEKIHALLQSAVDREIQKTGYLPSPQSEPDQVNGSNGLCITQDNLLVPSNISACLKPGAIHSFLCPATTPCSSIPCFQGIPWFPSETLCPA
jgi:hypothetical protein